MHLERLALMSALCIGASLVADAADWPQWRGPQRHGVSAETGLSQQWPAGGPTLAWQVNDIGVGYATVAGVGDRLYIRDRGTLWSYDVAAPQARR